MFSSHSFHPSYLSRRAAALALLLTAAMATANTDFVPPGERTEKSLAGGKLPFWGARADQAEVLTATFLGGKGNEWLVAGGFQPDGTVVVLGNIAGPTFDMPAKITVLGKDGTPPPEPALAKDKKGEPLPPSWTLPGITGFIAFLSPDLKTVKGVVRLPWDSAAITSAVVDAKGDIYLAGRATDRISSLGAFEKVEAGPDAERKEGTCDHTFVAKLSSDASRLLWGRESKGLSDAPRLALGNDGSVTFSAQDVKHFSPDGKLLSSVVIPGGVRETTSVNPVDGTIVKGGEHHWPTGREPWRCPTLNIYQPDGALLYQLYDWPGPYVGLDNLRLVSDSAIRLVSHDSSGNLLFMAWSDGGNSVMLNQPTDVRRSTGLRGTGLNASGAGATSFAYLVKVDPKDYEIIGWTFWGTRYKGKANGIRVSTIDTATDGSFCLAGRASWGLSQTPNFIGKSEPGGEYVAVLTPDMSGVRFCSTVPGTGAATIGNEPGDSWGIGSGTVGGKARVLFLSGAKASGEVYGHTSETPTVNALQPAFGGGWSDGYLLVLDLSNGSPAPAATAAKQPPARMGLRGSSGSKKSKDDAPVADGKVAVFTPDIRKYATVDLEARDASGKMWPNFLYGKPLEGEIRHAATGDTGSFAVLADNWAQPKGSQQRRVLGDWFDKSGTPPDVKFTVRSLGPPQTEDITSTDKKGNPVTSTVTYQMADALLEAGKMKLPVRAKCAITWNAGGRDGSTVGVRVNAYFTAKAADLGLKTPGDQEIDFRITMQGYEK